MAYGMTEKQVYANDVSELKQEPTLVARLEEIRSVLHHTLVTLGDLQHGPSPEKDPSGGPTPEGVLTLGAECEKLANAVLNEAMVVSKRIGRL